MLMTLNLERDRKNQSSVLRNNWINPSELNLLSLPKVNYTLSLEYRHILMLSVLSLVF